MFVCLLALSEQLLSDLVLYRLLLYRVFSLSQIFQFAQILTNAVSFLPSVISMPSVGIVKDLTYVRVRRGLLVMASFAKVKRITYNLLKV